MNRKTELLFKQHDPAIVNQSPTRHTLLHRQGQSFGDAPECRPLGRNDSVTVFSFDELYF